MKHDDATRKTVYAKVCAPGADALRAFCLGHGVTVAAFIDGLSHVLCPARDRPIADLEAEWPALAEALLNARAIDADRRSREPRPARPDSNHRPAS